MQITENVTMLEATRSSHAFLLKGKHNYLIDTGMPGQGKNILEELNALGIAPRNISAILLTHHDVDHIGNAKMLQEVTNAKLFAPLEDLPYIMGEKKRPGVKRVIGSLVRTGKPLIAGNYTEELLFGEIKPVSAPGHTPGHTMFLFENVLFCGDLLMYRGHLKQPPSFMNWDGAKMKNSLTLLNTLNFEWICPSHSGPIRNDKAFRTDLGKLSKVNQ